MSTRDTVTAIMRHAVEGSAEAAAYIDGQRARQSDIIAVLKHRATQYSVPPVARFEILRLVLELELDLARRRKAPPSSDFPSK